MYDMSTLEIPQIYPLELSALLFVIKNQDFLNVQVIKFDIYDVNPHLPYHVSF